MIHPALLALLAIAAACTRNVEPTTSPIAHRMSRDIVQDAQALISASIADDFGPPRVVHPSQRMRARALEKLAIACFERDRLDGCTTLMSYMDRDERHLVALHAKRLCSTDPEFCELAAWGLTPPWEECQSDAFHESLAECREGALHKCECGFQAEEAKHEKAEAVQNLQRRCEAGSSVACDVYWSLLQRLSLAERRAARDAIKFNLCFVQQRASACEAQRDALVRDGRLLEARKYGEYACRLSPSNCYYLAMSYAQGILPLPSVDRTERLFEHVCRYARDENERRMACAWATQS